FPFLINAGFTGFDTPATFRQVNRALRARIAVYSGDAEAAISALGESCIDPGARVDLGAYYPNSISAGDATNGLSSSNQVVHPSVIADAMMQSDGATPDARVGRKLLELDEPVTLVSGSRVFSSQHRFAVYFQNPTASTPLIRNEELLLIRAEANIALGNFDEALTDINIIRESSGGLAPLDTGSLDADNAEDELLFQRRYSLLMEGGHRWIDMRRFGRLDELLEDDESGGLNVHQQFPIPVDEANARADSGDPALACGA
ncbi:MAG: RagB/SusD family nutrient uptake outer membrane protein, partial [Myxococcota bacterium]